MKIKIRTKDIRFSMPLPAAMVEFIIKFIPERVFKEIGINIPKPYCNLITKENISMLLGECLDILKENKGLEIVHVETEDGTFISVKL